MKKSIAILAVLSLVAFAGQIAVDLGPVGNGDGDWLNYDDGSPKWLTWGGKYRGTWFNVQDFFPSETNGWLEQSRLWFYHHASYPWDTSDFYVEIWNGDVSSPMTQLDQQTATALHYAPVYVDYSHLDVEQNFWCLANTELSSGGWPSILGDGQNPDPSGIDHSYFSDDFIVWEPWNINGACFYFIAVNWNEPNALDNTTWGSLKATF
ncbi:hypothetical protein CSA37_04725 [Candidatus Fermentibacteria bacterium]|nr:MAG: hypothetical protein CSA37_04725 [Candidatus Fermentibacteria bacterium]